jgi:hypothetical protein
MLDVGAFIVSIVLDDAENIVRFADRSCTYTPGASFFPPNNLVTRFSYSYCFEVKDLSDSQFQDTHLSGG